MTMGERIAALRKGRGMTQEQLAEHLSVTRQSVSKWELDQATPEMSFAVSLCELFGVSMDYLVRGTEASEIRDVQPRSLSQTVEVLGEKEPPRPAVLVPKPPSATWYACFFGLLLLMTGELCLHGYLLASLFHFKKDFATLFLLLFPLVIPLPAVYLAVHRRPHRDARHALRHLWLISVCVAVTGNVLFIGGFEAYCLYVHTELDSWFWFTPWYSIGYRCLVGELMTLAVLLPVLVRFRHKKWICWLSYLLSQAGFAVSLYVLDILEGLIPGGRFGWYWCLLLIGCYFLMMGLVLLSQILVYRRLRQDAPSAEIPPPKPLRGWHAVGIAALSVVAVVSVMGGVYYALLLPGLPTEYLPASYPLVPLLSIAWLYRGQERSARAAWRDGGLVLLLFLPLVLAGHGYLQEFFWRFQVREPLPNPGGYGLASVISALAGSIVAWPALAALRKRPYACMAVAAAVILLTVAATLLLPSFRMLP